ncbi:MAG: hypothetical protein JNL98_44280, partial [Bryobacterales bacterium]|nr:hypothetical protein [Bryobacterales bacterium]
MVARIRARAAAAERKRLSGIRALARPGQESVVQACCDDAACSVEAAALRLLQHERSAQADHMARMGENAETALRKLGARLGHVQFSDVPGRV